MVVAQFERHFVCGQKSLSTLCLSDASYLPYKLAVLASFYARPPSLFSIPFPFSLPDVLFRCVVSSLGNLLAGIELVSTFLTRTICQTGTQYKQRLVISLFVETNSVSVVVIVVYIWCARSPSGCVLWRQFLVYGLSFSVFLLLILNL